MEKLIRKQLVVWFGLPISTAIVISAILVAYFLQMNSIEIAVYIGVGKLMAQIGAILLILFGLYLCIYVTLSAHGRCTEGWYNKGFLS